MKQYADLIAGAVGVALIAAALGILTAWPVAMLTIGIALVATALVVPPWA